VGLIIQLFRARSRERYMATKTNPFTFIQQVRSEVAKVTWPTRRETLISTVMVFIMVAFAATFLFVSDQLIAYAIGYIMGTGR
jgi:preprotein translocase subunit SecE